jgi:hypothetical protein
VWPWKGKSRGYTGAKEEVPTEAARLASGEEDSATAHDDVEPAPPGPDEATGRPVDICFVFDTTGSMSGKIEGLTRCMVNFVGELSRLRLDWRITAVPFGDLTVRGDRVVGDLPFVGTHDEAEQMLQTLPRFSGGGNVGESSLEAVLEALGKPYRKGTVIVLVVLTDEPPLESGELTADYVADKLLAREIICFVASSDFPGFRRWAAENGGKWYPIRQSMDTRDLLGYLRSLVRDLPKVAKAVHDVGGGSVRRYLDIGRERGEDR